MKIANLAPLAVMAIPIALAALAASAWAIEHPTPSHAITFSVLTLVALPSGICAFHLWRG